MNAETKTKHTLEPWKIKMGDVVLGQKLHHKWIGNGQTDLKRIKEVMKRERAALEKGIIPCGPGLLTEIRHEQKLVGIMLKRAAVAKAEGRENG